MFDNGVRLRFKVSLLPTLTPDASKISPRALSIKLTNFFQDVISVNHANGSGDLLTPQL